MKRYYFLILKGNKEYEIETQTPLEYDVDSRKYGHALFMCSSVEELIKEADELGLSLIDTQV